ncbi:MAG: hypothetical protein AAF702_45275 [Chloroflexota bacterium]
MDEIITIKCYDCHYTWTMTYNELKDEAIEFVPRNEGSSIETYVVKCPENGTYIAVEIELEEGDE